MLQGDSCPQKKGEELAVDESTSTREDAAEAAAQLTALEAARLRGFVDGAEVRDNAIVNSGYIAVSTTTVSRPEQKATAE